MTPAPTPGAPSSPLGAPTKTGLINGEAGVSLEKRHMLTSEVLMRQIAEGWLQGQWDAYRRQ